jgi:hypothetical protein
MVRAIKQYFGIESLGEVVRRMRQCSCSHDLMHLASNHVAIDLYKVSPNNRGPKGLKAPIHRIAQSYAVLRRNWLLIVASIVSICL